MARRRSVSAFGMSFLDCICCGFGAVILLYVIINARAAATQDRQILDLRGEVSRLDFEVMKGQRNLVLVRNALDETIEELVRTEGRSRVLLDEIREVEVELADRDETTVATREHVNKLQTDLKSLEEEVKRMEAAIEADREGSRLRERKGTGDRHYLTGLKVGGKRIVLLVDCSSSMLNEKVVDVLRLRNMSDAAKQAAPKWTQAVRTIDWLTTQLPPDAVFQIIGFNEKAFPLVPGTDGVWLSAGDPEDLNRAADAMKAFVPDKGTSLHNAINALKELPAPPDNIILLTDGLPTMTTVKPRGYRVSGKRRLQIFRSAVPMLPSGVPVNVILLPMEGDPDAAHAFWRLAIDTRGSYFCPAKDWP